CAESYAEIGCRAGAGKEVLHALAVGHGQAASVRWFKERVVPRKLLVECSGLISCASGQSRECRPAGAMRAGWREKGREAFERRFGEAPVGRYLAAEDRQ